MKRNILSGFVAAFLLFGMTGLSQAALTTIGTATYKGSEYKLIWDDDNLGNSVVWLDYAKGADLWSNQMSWAANLDGDLTYNIDSAYTVDWGTNSWRLPDMSAAVPGYVHNNINNEMAHLYYTELGYPSYNSLSKNYGEFDNISGKCYVSGTPYMPNQNFTPGYVWYFCMQNGYQNAVDGTNLSETHVYSKMNAIAIRTGTVSTVPIPAAAWLLGSGLVGLIGARRKFQK